MPSYELMFIVKPELDEEQVVSATDKVHQLVVANGGNVTKTAAWGKRRLAYQVGTYREGHYVVSNFDIAPDKIVEIERVIKISDTVFRHLLVRRDKPVVGPSDVSVPEELGEGAEGTPVAETAAAPAEDGAATTAGIDEAQTVAEPDAAPDAPAATTEDAGATPATEEQA